jgi:hypothetical protein
VSGSPCHGLRRQLGVDGDWVVLRCSCGDELRFARCWALKRDGARCPAYQVPDSRYCRMHRPSAADERQSGQAPRRTLGDDRVPGADR